MTRLSTTGSRRRMGQGSGGRLSPMTMRAHHSLSPLAPASGDVLQHGRAVA